MSKSPGYGSVKRRAGYMGKKIRTFGRTCHAGGRRIELTSEYYEWNDWANEWLNIAASLETAVRINDHDTLMRIINTMVETVQKRVGK